MKKILKATVESTDDDIELGLEEVTRLVSQGMTSGFNRNDTGRFRFDIIEVAENPEEADIESCSTCGTRLDETGDGYNGLGADCADKKENASAEPIDLAAAFGKKLNRYDKGFLDALESMQLALRAEIIDETKINGALQTAMDAFQNNAC